MNNTKLCVVLCAVSVLLAVVQMQAQAGKKPTAIETEKKAVASQVKDKLTQPEALSSPRIPEPATKVPPAFVPAFTTSEYILVTGVLDQFGKAAESDSFKLVITCGGQPTPPGISTSSNYQLGHGYAHTAAVLHGDANGNGQVEAGDIVYLLGYLYQSGPPPVPLEAGDANCDGIVNGPDISYLQNYLYRGGAPPCDPPA